MPPPFIIYHLSFSAALDDDLRKVVESQFFIFHYVHGLWLETGCKGTQ